MGFAEELLVRAKKLNKRIVLPETEDERTLQAAARLAKEQICRVVLVGVPEQVRADAAKCGADLSGCEILSPLDEKATAPLAEKLYQYRKEKGLTQDQARQLIKDYLYFATMLLKEGIVDGYVAGATHTTGENLRPGLQIVKAMPGLKTVSSFFVMIHPNPRFGENGVMIYSDCGMVEMPTAEQLADIAIASARSWRQLVGTEPRVAMLSYSTKGSAKSTDTERVLKALELVKKADPKLCVDGEMQFDAAVIPSIGERKAKGSSVAGKANVFIFPDLDAGNIGYKITERIGGAQALGPLVQGMAKPAHDLSRGCSADDIVKVAAISAIMAGCEACRPPMFRPCIDLHEGKVKQIVGGTLGDLPGQLQTNFVSDRSAAWFAELYRRDALTGGHVIMLGPGNEAAARQALMAYPGGLQVGGGITLDNAPGWLQAGASHVIVTSWVFRDGRLEWDRLRALVQAIGRQRLVLDLSCRRRGSDYLVVTDRWQKFTELALSRETLEQLAGWCDEFLVHAVDVEGLCRGVDLELVEKLAAWSPLPTTYAGGARSLADLEAVAREGRGRIDLTIGSALDIFGGTGVRYDEVVAFNRAQRRNRR